MSGIVLSSSVRQNLLSLQSTADLLATTQNRLATGKKVNSALDNPTNFFTASSLNSRASDINNLLDGIGNGVQVLQAANTGITSLQKLVDSAKSIANQALQTTVGYVKSSATGAVSGATAGNLLGTTAQVTSSVNGSVLLNNASQTYTAVTAPPGDPIEQQPSRRLRCSGPHRFGDPGCRKRWHAPQRLDHAPDHWRYPHRRREHLHHHRDYLERNRNRAHR